MKKQNLFLLLCFIAITNMNAQSWNLGLNTIGGTPPNFGTLNNHPINFYTNGVKRAAFSTAGVLNISGLSGSGNRFLQVNSTGDLIAWTGNTGDGTKALFGDNTWREMPFTTAVNRLALNTGVKFGVGISDPTYAVDVAGDGSFTGFVKAPSGFMFSNSLGLTYNSTNGFYRIGKKFDDPNAPSVDPCYDIANTAFFQFSGGGFETFQAAPNNAPNVNASMRVFVSANDGNGYIETTGANQSGLGVTSLNLNNICGRNTNINTGPYAGIVNIGSNNLQSQVNLGYYVSTGDFVKMAKHLEIGNTTTGITGSPNNIALDIFANDGKGIRLKTSNTTTALDLLQVEYINSNQQSSTTFNVNGLGKTTINCGETRAITVKDLYGAGNPETFSVDKDGSTKISTNNTKAFSISNIGSSSTNEVVSIDKNGYTEYKIYSPSSMPIPGYGTSGSPINLPRVITIRDMYANNGSGKDLFVVRADGTVFAREIEINNGANFPDYVFENNYKLLSFAALQKFISENKHLPGFEKASFYEDNGISVNNLLIKQQEKIEELTLYILQLENRLSTLENK